MTLYIITVANKSKFYFPYLVQSIKKNNNELIVLGKDMEWKGFNWKLNLMIEELKKYDSNEIICFVDGFDVICTRDLNELTNEFIKIKEREKCKIITGYDYVPNNIIKTITSLYFTKTTDNLVLNSGTYIGYVKDILEVLETVNKIDPNDNADDQILLNKYNEKNPGSIYIDTNFEIFLTIGDPLTDLKKFVIIKDNNVYINNNRPFFIHAAGSGYLDSIIIDLNYEYDYNNKIKDQIKKEYLNKSIAHFTNIVKYNYNNNKIKYNCILILIICILIIRPLMANRKYIL